MEELGNYILIFMIGMSIFGFYMMYDDKKRAKQKQYRVKERTLWIMAILGGATGITLAMPIFKHKTKHLNFKIGMPLITIIQIITTYIFIDWLI